MTTENDQYDAWLASACLPPAKVQELLGIYGDSRHVYEAFVRKEPEINEILSPGISILLERNCTQENLTRFNVLMKKYCISVLRFSDPEYPESLRLIDDSPAILFCQGNPECMKSTRILSMVGSRAASYAGQKAAQRIAEELSRHHVSIVSGLACGIDASAHQGCLDGGSSTIAVMGCGLDKVYPKDNEALRDRILAGNGLIVSEYAPGEKPSGWHFPFRNRIIAGLSRALILVEARIRSGSMTSVQHALNQGKDVFVYPGDPDSEFFEGNHQLLREGGIYFTGTEDILEDLHWLDNPPAVRQNIGCSAEREASTPEEAAVLHALEKGKMGFEQLLNATGLNPSILMSTLTILQISGVTEALPGKQYQLKH